MTDRLDLDDQIHTLHLGKSFDPTSATSYHAVRYDFKPNSLDPAQPATVEVGKGQSLSVKVPHIAGSSTTHTEYKGNARECAKEYLLFINHATGEMTLEKLSSNWNLKTTRDATAAAAPPADRRSGASTATKELPVKRLRSEDGSGAKTKSPAAAAKGPLAASQTTVVTNTAQGTEGRTSRSNLSDESSAAESEEGESSSSDDSSDDDAPPAGSANQTSSDVRPAVLSTLSQDLQLSDSDSD